MPGLLQRLFGKTAGPGDSPERGTGSGEAPQGVQPDERLEDLYVEFCNTFYVRPGVKLMDLLKAEGVTRMIGWLRPDSSCAVPGGLIRLGVDFARKGIKIWEQPGISMNYEGNWDHGGVPEQESLDALSVLAQVIRKPITLYFKEKPDGEQMLMRFEP